MKFSEKLKSLRKEHNLTQVELAESLYVSRSLVARWEYGDVYPTIENLNKISSYFDIPIGNLLCEDEKTEIIVHQVNLERKIKKILRISLLTLIIVYSIVMPILYCLKIFSIIGYGYSGNNYTGNDVDFNVFHYSVLDCILPEDSWLLLVSPMTNLVLIISAILAFSLKRKRIKNILIFVTIILFIVSLVFVILTFVLGTKHPIGILPKFM